ncbi:hypothetical protein ACFL7M_13100 [Thermodesulfobacteriota bacterium]
MALDSEKKDIERIIQEFDIQIEDMHRKIRRHLLDKKKYPRPYYESLIAKIVEYQITESKNKVLGVLLDNLKYKANHRASVWRRWFEEDTKEHSQKEKDYSTIVDLNHSN